ncbi:MAG TPA: thiamine pyrophosphate-binding protein [Streptosporangiaceae bacterium]|nr:thiamine pyrophosphate-binding protein [Streptosporangiaceae bacterium]
MTQSRSGAEVLLEILETEHVRYIFGNPGTTELPLMDALAGDSRFHYVLALHESVAAGMADGYAQATGRPSFVNLHTAAGLGNAMGNLSNSRATGTPMVVTAGQQDQRHLMAEPFLSGNLTGMADGLVKSAQEVHRVADLGPALRRAFHDAASPPTGPVFISIPMDILQDLGVPPAPAPSRIEWRTVPAMLPDLASSILAAPRAGFAVIAGDEVARSGAVDALVSVAERLGCPVYGPPMHSSLVFPTAHPLWAGPLAPDADQMRAELTRFSAVLLIGSRGFMTFGYQDTWPVPPGLRLLHLSPAAGDLGRTYPTSLGLVGDPRATLEALLPLLSGVDETQAAELIETARARSADRLARLTRQASEARPDELGRMHPLPAVQAALAALPPETVVVDEAVTSDPYVRALHAVRRPGRFLYSRGGGLGWGLPAAMGVSLGRDREPVVAVLGDGSFLYSPQALWTAVRENLPVVSVVLNNRGYLILRRFLAGMRGPAAEATPCVGMDITEPSVDLAAIARGLGARAVRVDRLAEVGQAVREALADGLPTVLDVQVAAPPLG